jgi:flagellar motor switch protein FliM
LRGALQEAPTELEAVLARMTLPMSKVEDFQVDQVIPLAGTTVGSVRLLGPSGEYIAMARLGQVAGKRAVRLEMESIELQDDNPRTALAATPLPELEVQSEAPQESAAVQDKGEDAA